MYYPMKSFACIKKQNNLNSIVPFKYFLDISLNSYDYSEYFIFEISRKPTAPVILCNYLSIFNFALLHRSKFDFHLIMLKFCKGLKSMYI